MQNTQNSATNGSLVPNLQLPHQNGIGMIQQVYQTPQKGSENIIPPVGATQQLHAMSQPQMYPLGYPQHEQLAKTPAFQNVLAQQMQFAQPMASYSQPQFNFKPPVVVPSVSVPTCEVTVTVKCPQTLPGERVALLGATEELGRWDIERATYLETNDHMFPTWTVKLKVPRDSITEYKYLIIQSLPANNMAHKELGSQMATPVVQARWESLGVSGSENRRMNTHGKKIVHLHEEFGCKQVIEEYVEDRSAHISAALKAQPDMLGSVDLRNNQIANTPTAAPGLINIAANPAQPSQPADAIKKPETMDYFTLQQTAMNPLNQSQSQMDTAKANAVNSALRLNSGALPSNNSLAAVPLQQANVLGSLASLLSASATIGQPLGNIGASIPTKMHVTEQATVNSQTNSLNNMMNLNQMRQAPVETQDKLDRKDDAVPTQQRSAQKILENNIGNSNERRIESSKVPAAQRPTSMLTEFADPCFKVDQSEPIILATFLLPYAIGRDRKTGALSISPCFHNPTLLYGALENMRQKRQFNFKWVGLVTTLEDMSDQEKADLEEQLRKRDAYPIFMTAEETGPYLMFYENQMRPLFHNFKDLYDLRSELNKHWKSFIEVSQRFADKIVDLKNELMQEGQKCTKIWVHNNQLIMVPLYVRKQFEQANIGFSCHSPFPSSAHFRTFKFRLKVLESLLHCDLVAFHLFMYARNFIKTCERILGLELEFLRGGHMGINFQGKHVLVRVSHIGIEESFIEDLTSGRQFESGRKSFRTHMTKVGADMGLQVCEPKEKGSKGNNLWREYDDQDTFMEQTTAPIIISSIDSYHPISGLKHKLRAYRNFLEKYPAYRNRIIYIQFVGSTVQAFDQAEGHQRQVSSIRQMRDDIIALVDDIHKKFGKSCLMFEESNPTLTRRLVLWTESDIIWCSSLKDGLCIQVLEYVVCRKLAKKMSESIMICSEFAGCNEAMRGVLRYNPFSIDGFEEQLGIAMQMPKKQRLERMQLAYSHIQRTSMTKWTENFLVDLMHAYQPNLTSIYLGMTFSTRTRAGKSTGIATRMMAADREDFTKLNLNQCYSHLLKAKRSVIIVEMEALPHQKFTKNSIPTVEVIEQLHSLMTDSRNTVIIIGNHTKNQMEDWFLKNNKLAANGANFWLAAESGYLYTSGNDKKWSQLGDPSGRGDRTNNFSWKQQVRKIMQGFAENIDGSFIEERESCLIWNFKNSESEHSSMFIQELYNTIQKVLQKYHRQTYGQGPSTTDIILGNGYLEVKPAGVKKKKLMNLFLERISKTHKIDFLFYLGNDTEDEVVFEFLRSRELETKGYIQNDCSRYICVLEKKPSEARYYLEDLDHVRPLLQKFQTATQNRKRNFSCADLALAAQDQSLSNKKLQSGVKNASIANLNLYMHGQLGLDEQNHSRFQNSSGFIPYQQRGKQGSFANLSVNNQIIEEGARESSDEDSSYRKNKKIVAENRAKFPSVGDTTKKMIDDKPPLAPGIKKPAGTVATETTAQLEGGQPLSSQKTLALEVEKVLQKNDTVNGQLKIDMHAKSHPPSARNPLENTDEQKPQQSESSRMNQESESFFQNRNKSPNQNNALELPSIRREDSEFESFKDKRDNESLIAKSMFTNVAKTMKERVECVDDFSKHSQILQKNEVSDMMSVGDVGPHKGQQTVAFNVGQGLNLYNCHNSQGGSRSNSMDMGCTKNIIAQKHYDSERNSADNFQNAVETSTPIMDSVSAQLPVGKKINEQFDSFSSDKNCDNKSKGKMSPISPLNPTANFVSFGGQKLNEEESQSKIQNVVEKVDSKSTNQRLIESSSISASMEESKTQVNQPSKQISACFDDFNTPNVRKENMPFVNSDLDMNNGCNSNTEKHQSQGQGSIPQFKLALKSIKSNDPFFSIPLTRQATGVAPRERLLSDVYQNVSTNKTKKEISPQKDAIDKMSAKESFKLMLKLDEVSDKPGQLASGGATGLQKKMSGLGGLGLISNQNKSKMGSAQQDHESSFEDAELDGLNKGMESDGEGNMMDFDLHDNSDELMQ